MLFKFKRSHDKFDYDTDPLSYFLSLNEFMQLDLANFIRSMFIISLIKAFKVDFVSII